MHSWFDVYCLRNQVYYEAQVVKTVPKDYVVGGRRKKRSIGTDGAALGDGSASGGGAAEKVQETVRLVLFHFKGWGAKFDEWISADSERIQPHCMFTTH